MPDLNEIYVSSSEAARMLGMHPLAVHRLIYGGKLPAEKIASRWLIRRATVEELAKSYVPRRGRPRQGGKPGAGRPGI